MTDDSFAAGVEVSYNHQTIAFFAHKGGVSKTTNAYHLAWMMAKEFNKRVVLIDADPQCNLTQTLCKKSREKEGWRDDVPRGDIYTAIEPVHTGTKRPGELLEPATLVEIKPKHFKGDDQGALFLLPGSLDLAMFEPQLTFAHNLNNADCFPIFADVAGGFRCLFNETARAYDADIVIIDMGPSIGELNKNLFWSSDYFLIPCSPDAYCKTTISTMEQVLPRWAQEQERLRDATAHQTMPINPNPPKFLGIVMSLFNVSGAARKPVKHSAVWMDLVKQAVASHLVPALNEVGMVHEYQSEQHTLAEIPHFLSLMPVSQRANYPVFDIPDEKYVVLDGATGEFKPMPNTEKNGHKKRAGPFHDLYFHFAQNLISLLAGGVDESQLADQVQNMAI